MASDNPTNTAPGSAGQNGAHTPGLRAKRMDEITALADDLIEHNRKRLLMEAAAPQMLEALRAVLEDGRYFVLRHETKGAIRTAIAAATGEAV